MITAEQEWKIHRYNTRRGVLGAITYRTLDTYQYLLKVTHGSSREWVWAVLDKTRRNPSGGLQHVTGGTVTTRDDAKAAALQWLREHP